MKYGLPTSVEVCGKIYEIETDFRVILDICEALQDPELDLQGKAYVALTILYPEFDNMPPEHYQEALDAGFRFIDCGIPGNGAKSPQLMDWAQDFPYIVAPINRALGKEVRALEYLHWWTFISAFMEIGDCFFAQIVNIRNKKARNKQRDKAEQEFYIQNRNIIDIKSAYTEADDAAVSKWLGK